MFDFVRSKYCFFVVGGQYGIRTTGGQLISRRWHHQRRERICETKRSEVVRAYVENLTRHVESHGKLQFVTRDTMNFDKFFRFFKIIFF